MDGTLEKPNELPPPPLSPWLPPQANDPALVVSPVPLPAMVRGRSERSGRCLAAAAFVCGVGAWGLFFAAVGANNALDGRLGEAVAALSPLSALLSVTLGIAGITTTRTGRYRRLAVVGIVLAAIYLAFLIIVLYSVITTPQD